MLNTNKEKFSELLNYLEENLIAYEEVFTKLVTKKYPLSHKFRRELKLIQKFMNLSNEQVETVETKVLLQLLRNRKRETLERAYALPRSKTLNFNNRTKSFSFIVRES